MKYINIILSIKSITYLKSKLSILLKLKTTNMNLKKYIVQ